MDPREELWAAAMRAERRGDAAAYEGLLADIAKTLRALIRGRLSRLGMNAHETEDILQDVLIGLHTVRHSWDANRPFLPWLHAIVRYKLSDAVRRRRREARYRYDLTLEEWSYVPAATHEDPDLGLVDLNRHLGELSAGQREVVRSLALEGASVRETAQKLKTSEGAVRVTLHRALQRLASIANLAASRRSKEKT
ncbi:MAG: polymerase sigma factor protein [Gammaproteobacteria bacterium]|jgi:RNA polymerase sigma-70 factor (ECF subfamily)|nr:polymerase sigma factor protein [Gammaproteobacteria bacterium]HEV7445039.1 sigma-70 family RNA polymerase sigma factor [Steroidobacteraceae bacterium]